MLTKKRDTQSESNDKITVSPPKHRNSSFPHNESAEDTNVKIFADTGKYLDQKVFKYIAKTNSPKLFPPKIKIDTNPKLFHAVINKPNSFALLSNEVADSDNPASLAPQDTFTPFPLKGGTINDLIFYEKPIMTPTKSIGDAELSHPQGAATTANEALTHQPLENVEKI